MRNYLAFFLLFISVVTFSEKIENMRKRLDTLEKGIETREKNIESAKKDEKDLEKKYNSTLNELNKIKEEYYEVESRYLELNRKIEYGERSLEVMQREIEDKNFGLKDKLALWYKYGNKKHIEYLFTGHNLFEMYDRKSNLKLMLENERSSIERINLIKKKLESEKSKIESEKKQLSGLKSELYDKKNKMNIKAKERDALLQKIKRKQKIYKAEIATLKKDIESTKSRIDNIIKGRVKKSETLEVEQVREKIGKMSYPTNGEVVVTYDEYKTIKYNAGVKSTGLEIKSRLGDRVKASGAGEVIYAGKFESMGRMVIIDHGYGLTSVYGNLVNSYVKAGDKVEQGTKIGVLGLSRNEREPILYFELRLNVTTINPFLFLEMK